MPPDDAEALAEACLERLEQGTERRMNGMRSALLRSYATEILLDRTEEALARLTESPVERRRPVVAVGG